MLNKHCTIHFTIYVSQRTLLSTLSLYSDVCQLYLIKTVQMVCSKTMQVDTGSICYSCLSLTVIISVWQCYLPAYKLQKFRVQYNEVYLHSYRRAIQCFQMVGSFLPFFCFQGMMSLPSLTQISCIVSSLLYLVVEKKVWRTSTWFTGDPHLFCSHFIVRQQSHGTTQKQEEL